MATGNMHHSWSGKNNAPLPTVHTTTALNRWSVADKQLPPVDKIKTIHVYDFDNTLFNSPLPNPKIWNGPTIGLFQTQDVFATGGWWHDVRILAATGEGADLEEKRGWAGWWNEQIVQLIQLSMQQEDALTVLLTGRSEHGFAELINRMVASRELEFDMVVLKPKAGPNNQRFGSTMLFKQAFLETLMETYKVADEIRIYEDRVKHVKGFRDFFMDYNKRQNGIGGYPTRGPITAEVIQVADSSTLLDPVIEASEIQRIINDHNGAVTKGTASVRSKRLCIKKTVFYTGYLITQPDTQKLLSLVHPPQNMPESELKYLANNILITPRPAPNSILDKVGGIGNKLLWEVTGTASFESKVWACSVRPVPQSSKFYTENPVPIVVLALRKGARPIDAAKIQNWQPVPPEKQFIFETTVGEKVLLRVEEEDKQEGEYESLFPNKSHKRKHIEDDGVPRGPSGRGGHRNNHQDGGGRGGRGGFNQPRHQQGRGGGRGGRSAAPTAGRGRGRGGHNYRSLDDVGSQVQQGHAAGITYEDFPSLPTAYQRQQTEGQRMKQGEYDNRRVPSGPQGQGRGGGGLGQYY
ncbi:hypothetical protein V490_03186 [Pseudogymnoascus sp. VKM F-3557]|nr:hypothetical protein V490_03186 [Pseudogymnoascus sp. VKM F-3557]